jgi:hypothetical protein
MSRSFSVTSRVFIASSLSFLTWLYLHFKVSKRELSCSILADLVNNLSSKSILVWFKVSQVLVLLSKSVLVWLSFWITPWGVSPIKVSVQLAKSVLI